MVKSPAKAQRSANSAVESTPQPSHSSVLRAVDNAVGIALCAAFGGAFAYYMFCLHEARLWFSNIKEVEREISFRTESGLYYSYFKQLVHEPNLNVGLRNLMHDRTTEHPREINILQRFNVHQEVLLAALYSHFRPLLPASPSVFYSNCCFVFSGLSVSAIFALSWRFSKHWLFGALAAAFMFVNLDESTRVFFTVNLRENFALPFFWLQNAAILSAIASPKRSWPFVALFTLLFTVCWQFNQFLLLLQSVSLLVVVQVFPETSTSVKWIVSARFVGYLLAATALFLQQMMLFSVSLCVDGLILLLLVSAPPKSQPSIPSIFVRVPLVLFAALALNFLLKYLFDVQSDTHVWSFLKAKFGLASLSTLSFESALYVCHGAFAFLDYGFVERTLHTGVLPLYLLCILIVAGATLLSLFKGTPYFPEFFNAQSLFLACQSILCGIMAVMTMRMKYVWFPLMAVMGVHSLFVFDRIVGRFPKYALAGALTVALLNKQYNVYITQIANEQEFYDPDTVDLMEWINTLPTDASFTGSMQLLAGVKCCTGRPITNHPHFEDKWLRERTQRLYDIYGRRPISDVHGMLKREKTDYIILEDSICLSPSTGCSTNDLVDMANREPIDSAIKGNSPSMPRFCDEIRKMTAHMQKYFALVFANRTFRVYQVL